MKTSNGSKFVTAALALLLSAGCAATPRVASNSPRTVTDTWATETPEADVNLRQDAYGNRTPPGQRKRFITGSFVPQDVTVTGNSANTALPTRVYGQGDLRRRGSGLSTAEGLSRVDPALTITNGRGRLIRRTGGPEIRNAEPATVPRFSFPLPLRATPRARSSPRRP